MGEEIEKYILKKLDDAIEESKDSTHFNIAARFLLPNLHKDLSELKDLIEKKRTKIKLAIAPAPAPAPRHTPAVRDPSAPAAAVRAPFAPCATAPTPHPTPASTSSASAKKDSKVLLPAAENKSQTPPNAADDKKDTPNPTDALGDKKDTHTGDPLDAIDDKKDPDTSAPLDAIGDKKDTGAPLDAIGDKKELDAPPDTGDKKDTDTVAPTDVGDKKDTGAPLDAIGHKKELDAPPDTGDKKDTDAPLDAMGDKKELDAPPDTGDKKDTDAPLDAGDEKESGAPSDAGAEKESTASSTGASEKESASDAGAEKESGAPLDAGAPLDDIAVDKKESTAPLDANDEKDKGAPLADSAEKESKAPLATTSSKTTCPDHYPTGVGGGKKQDNVGTSDKTTSQDESEISPATDTVTGDKSITPPSSAGGGQKESNDSDESEISPVTDGGATDHKSKTPTSVGGGKEESGISHADKSTTTAAAADTSTKSDSNSDAIKREEALLREQLYYLNNVLTEWQMITKKPFSYSDSVSSIKDLSKTLKKIKQDLKPESIKKTDESSDSHIPQTGSSDNASQIETTHEVMEFRWSTPVEPKNVHGFDARILSLERLLVLRRKDTDAFKAFGIHGMAGVGKTTLCQSIFGRPKVMKYFFPRIWVCLSKQKGEDGDNKKEVVKRMLRCLGIDDNIIKKVDEKQGIRGLLSALRLQLTGKRYFIVLDDAHNADKWFKMSDSDAENDNNKIYEKFSYGLPKEWGGTVLVTSRVEQVVKNMVGEEENLRRIEPLTDVDTCWNIFKDTVEKDNIQFPVDLVKLKLEIVKRCDGLPLAAKLLGQIKHEELRKNSTAAGNQQAAVQAGNRQAAVQASKQQAAVQAAK